VAGGSTSAPTISSFTPTIANAGAAVAISGTGFQTNLVNDKITINGLAFKTTAATATTLNTVIPTGVGSGKIKVTTPYGSATSATSIIIPPSTILSTDVIANAQLTVDGAAQSLAITTANKVGVALFDGTQNDYITIDVSNFVVNPTGGSVTYEVYKPDNSLLVSGTIYATATSIHLPLLPRTGTYAVYFKPGTSTVTLSIAVSHDPVVVTDGTAVAESINQTGQTTRLSFNATAGQNLGLGITGLTLSPTTSTHAAVNVYNSVGTQVGYLTCYTSYTANGGCGINLQNMAAGSYSIVVTPAYGATGSFTATLSSDVTGTLTSGTAYNLNLTRAGQNGRLTFSGTAGDSLGVNIVALVTSPASQSAYVYVLKPDGTTLGSVTATTTSGGYINLGSLPTTGTYTVFVDPSYAVTASMQVTAAPGVALVTDGASPTVTLNTAGQVGRLTFNATAGQNLGLGITGLTLTPSSSSAASVYIYKPDGSYLTNSTCYTSSTASGGCGFNLSKVPVSGSYSIVVTPESGGTGSFTATLSSDVTGTLTSGTAYNLNLARAGQNGRLTFSGTAGDSVGVNITTLVTSPSSQTTNVSVIKPDGTTLGPVTTSTSGGYIDLGSLPTTGTYTVFVDPSYAVTASMQVTVDPGVALVTDGASPTITLNTAGQVGRLTFNATAGQNLGLGITGLTLTQYGAIVNIYKPDGSSLISSSCTAASGGCGFNLSNVPVSGSYSIVVTPESGGTGSFTATLSSDVTGTLTSGTAYNLNLARAGQNGRLTFSGTAGGSVGVNIAALVTNPSSQTAYVTVLKPDGTTLDSVSTTTSGGYINLGSLPTTGTYTVFVDPSYAVTASMQVTVAPGVALVTDGASPTITLNTAGQVGRLTFNATAGQNLGLGITGLTLTPSSSSYAYVAVYEPDGTTLKDGTCYTSYTASGGCGFNLSNVPVSGTYSILVQPYDGGTGSFTATLSSDVTGTLTSGTAYNLNLTRAGQNGRLTFSGTAATNRTITMASITSNPAGQTVSFTIYKPDGSLFSSVSTSASTYTLKLTNLPATGNYTLFVDTYYAQTETMSITLSQ
jgi:hypothetical protein